MNRNNGNLQTYSHRSDELKYRGQFSLETHQELRDISVVSFSTPMDHITEDNFVYRTAKLTFERRWDEKRGKWLFLKVEFYSVGSGHNPSLRQELHTLTRLPDSGFIREAYAMSEPKPAFVEAAKEFHFMPGGRGTIVPVNSVVSTKQSVR